VANIGILQCDVLRVVGRY